MFGLLRLPQYGGSTTGLPEYHIRACKHRDGTNDAGGAMSFLKSLFGRRSSPGETGKETLGDPVDYNGFVIRAAPFKSEGQYQTAGIIAKDVAGVRREHRFIRADRHAALDDALSFSLTKAKKIVDEQGERMFD
jgi:hypothetical protein